MTRETGSALQPVTSRNDSTLTIVHKGVSNHNDYDVIESTKMYPGAWTMALDPSAHTAFLATASFEPAAIPAAEEAPKRLRPMLGSFVVLKFARQPLPIRGWLCRLMAWQTNPGSK